MSLFNEVRWQKLTLKKEAKGAKILQMA